MDLGGPKIRTGETRYPEHDKRLRPGVRFALVKPGGLAGLKPGVPPFAAECLLPEAIDAVQLGHRVFLDDAKAGGVVQEKEPWGVIIEIDHAKSSGVKL